MKLTCTVRSSATLATFKDIKAKITFLSKTGAKVLEKEFDIYEFIRPNKTIEYKTEMEVTNQQYKDIDEIRWSILNAKCS